MKRFLFGPFVFLLLSSTASGLGSVVSRFYVYNKSYYTWQEAQTYCRSFHTDLAILLELSDGDKMVMEQYDAWTGLHRGGEGTQADDWKWSTGSKLLYSEWALDEPNSTDRCAYVHYDSRKFYHTDCQEYYYFFCYNLWKNKWSQVFISQSKTWSDALEFCRRHYIDFIFYPTAASLRNVNGRNFPVWIGLHRDGDTWKWSSGSSDFRRWSGPTAADIGDCAFIYSSNKDMATQNCYERLPFICVDDNVLLVKESKTWEEALEHCRRLASSNSSQPQYDLLSVQPGEDHHYIMGKAMKADTEELWVGLRFLAGHWLWVTGADMLYTDLPECPLEGSHCGALTKTNMTIMETRDCTEKKNFLCYKTENV
ncbi:macrophage mannose receptor 1-like [Salarias fasciatus]|nr:macrophage mannose receptor 1-like [Salarias fasciatus]